jgi:hypothetical protein
MEVMDGVGHNLLVEKPQDTYELIYEFLKKF